LAGIGPEIVMKAVVDADVRAVCSPVIIGPLSELRRQAAALSLSADFPLHVTGQSSLCSSDQPRIFDTGNISESVPWGAESAASGRAAVAAIENCVTLPGQRTGRYDHGADKQRITQAGGFLFPRAFRDDYIAMRG